ncbi:MAG: TerC family protein [Planctomycetes bacterium]|nr:TerC family protein [Planctomycetota bacterium]
MSELLTSENLLALLTLSLLEIVLGIDNIVFLAILTGKLPPEERSKARRIGLALAMLMRIGLLLALSWVMRLTEPLVQPFGHTISGRDLILLGGGLFLIGKATWEIHDKLEAASEHGPKGGAKAAFGAILVQIVLLDIVFSLDSVITAVGMANQIAIMVAAVVIAVGVMLVFANTVSEFVERHPTIKMLALSFLILIGVMLVAEGMGKHIEKGYIYFAMAFSLLVEILNMRLRRKAPPVQLRHVHIEGEGPAAKGSA